MLANRASELFLAFEGELLAVHMPDQVPDVCP